MTTTTSTPTTDRPDLEELCTILYDRQFSTPFAEVYHAASDTHAGRIYRVVYYPESRAWTCQCQGFTAHGHCRHQRRADRLKRLRWWNARLVECTTPELLTERHRRQERVEAGQADADDHGCLDAIALRLDRERYSEVAK